jgi:predicted ATP-grasp superfamily ATP-dependent carboligase
MSEWPLLERRLRAVADDQALAVVLGGGAGGLSYARSLGRRRIPVLLVDAAGGIATHSRYVWSATLNGPLDHPAEWVDLLDRVGACLSRPGVLLPTNDVLTGLVARNAERLGRSFRFIVPSMEVVGSIVDKRTQYERAQAAGIPIPVTHFPESVSEVEQVGTTLRYPCIFKPYNSALGRVAMRTEPAHAGISSKALMVRDQEELVACFKRVATADARFMVQEFVPGDECALFGYNAFWDAEGREHSWMTKQKLRQFPLAIGSGSYQVSVDAPEVAELSRRLLKAFDYRGLVNVEFKLDSRDGTYRLIEINPRSPSGNQLAVSSGVDFPNLVYRYLTRPDGRQPPAVGFRRGVKWVNEDLDLQAFLALRKRRELSSWRWLRQLAGVRSWAVATPRDPVPFLVQVLGHGRGRRRRG